VTKLTDTCCRTLIDARFGVPTSHFTQTDRVLYLAVGSVLTEQGLAYFDVAVLYCPFCGATLSAPGN